MKKLLIIDAKYTLYESSIPFKSSLFIALKSMAHHFNAPEISEEVFNQIYGSFQECLDISLSIEKQLQAFLDSVFGKESFSAEKAIDYIHDSSKEGKFIYRLDKQFNYADLSYLKMYNDVYFYSFLKNPLKKLFLALILSSIIDKEYIVYEPIDIFKKWDKNQIFVVSQRPMKMKNFFIDCISSEEKFDYSKNFIYFTNPRLPYDLIKKFNDEANDLKIFWETFSLKLLAQKLFIVYKLASGEIKEEKLKFVGIFLDNKTIEKFIQHNYVQDFYPIIFFLHDPLSNRYNELINIFYAKPTVIAKRHCKTNFIELQECFDSILAIHQAIEKNRGYKIIDINNTREYGCYLSRTRTFDLFNSLFSDKLFLADIEKLSSTIKISFPKTIGISSTNTSNISSLKSVLDQYKFQFPVIIKSESTLSVLGAESHTLVVAATFNELESILKENRTEFAQLGDIIIQEIINDINVVIKIYRIYNELLLGFTNTLDDINLENKIIDGYKELKKPIKGEVDPITKNIAMIISDHLAKRGFINFGFDMVRKVNTNEFYVFDFNPDGGNWDKQWNKSEKPSEIFRNGIISLLNN